MQNKKTIIVRIVLFGVFVLAALLLLITKTNIFNKEQQELSQEKVDENVEDSHMTEQEEEVEDMVDAKGSIGGPKIENLPSFYTQDITALEIEDTFNIEDYYITSRYSASNHFYIDENKTLWATGRNDYGQMGNGSYGDEKYYEEPVKIAENVISVDTSWNGYFTIYLTENGNLYGMGSNFAGILLGKGSEGQVYSTSDYQKVTEPYLLMSDVAYARAGRECIVALKKDKSAYWWGQYAPLTHTFAGDVFNGYWTVEEDEDNPIKMLAVEPRKIMDNCKYITTGTFNGAAISEEGELYTWGCNIFGQCGTPVTGDDFIRTPVKVLDDVKMVWVETMYFNDPFSSPPEIIRRDSDYIYNTFVLQNDGSMLAAGSGLGNLEKVTEINGDLTSTEVNLYSDAFVPIQVIEYSEEAKREVLNQLTFGMKKETVEKILTKGGLTSHWMSYDDMAYFAVEDSRYYCYFDEDGGLYQLMFQEGGSRDGRFTIGMEFSEVEQIVTDAGYNLDRIEENSDSELLLYTYQDESQKMQYQFGIYDGKLSVLWEKR